MCWDNPQRGLKRARHGGLDVAQLLSAGTLNYTLPKELSRDAQNQAQAHFKPAMPQQYVVLRGFGVPFHQITRGYVPAPIGLSHVSSSESLEDCLPQAKRRAIESVPPADSCWTEESEEYGAEEEETPELADVTEAMPDECLSHIFGHMDEVQDRLACALVCRRWLHVLSLTKRRKPVQAPLQHAAASPQVPAASATQPGGSKTTQGKHGAADVDSKASTGLSRTLEGRSACDARLMAMAVSLAGRGGLEKLVVRGNRAMDGAESSASESFLPLTASGFQAIAQCSPGLRSVTLWDCEGLDDETVQVVARFCRKLEKLDIMNCPRVSDRGLLALARCCPHLSVLNISSCRMITDRGLQVLAQGCKMLTSLCLSGCPYVQGKGIAVVCSAGKKLKCLKLAGGLGLTDAGLKVIGESSTGLTRLRLCQLSRVSEAGFTSIGEGEGFKNLECLSVTACDGLTTSALDVIGRGCRNLRSLGLVSCSNVNDEGVLSILRTASELESLLLQLLPNITNEAARHALEHGGHLKSLTISNCKGVQDRKGKLIEWNIRSTELNNLKISNCEAVGNQCLTSMGKVGASLSTLDLCGLPSAGDKGVQAFLERCQGKLASIDLSGCTQITDRTVTSITEHCGDSVRSLSLDGCHRITDKSLRVIAKGCTALEDLDLSHCDITDRGLKALLSAVGPTLVNLSLSGCVRITDKSLEGILDACHSLSGLNLKNCCGLSKEAVDQMRQQAVSLVGPSCLFIDP